MHYGYDCEVCTFRIPVKTISDIINEMNIGEIELLALDIEGIDAEILLDLDLSKLNIKYLSFEHLHLGNNTDAVLNHLTKSGYEHLGLGVDYCGYDYLYINTRFKPTGI